MPTEFAECYVSRGGRTAMCLQHMFLRFKTSLYFLFASIGNTEIYSEQHLSH